MGNYTMDDWRKFLKEASASDLDAASKRLAQVAQTKVYLFWIGSRLLATPVPPS
jgi:hypothetical protein